MALLSSKRLVTRRMTASTVFALFAAACQTSAPLASPGAETASPGSSPGATGPKSPTASDAPVASAATFPSHGDVPFAHVIGRAAVGPQPSSVASAGGKLWVADEFGVTALDPETGEFISRPAVGMLATVDASEDGTAVLVASYADNTVSLLDPESGAVSQATEVECPAGMALSGATEAWVVSPCADRVHRVTIGSGVAETIDVDDPFAVAIGGGAVWVAAASGVTRFDIETQESKLFLAPRRGAPSDIAYMDDASGAGSLWMAAVDVLPNLGGAVVRIDGATLEAVRIDAESEALQRPAESIIVHDGEPWVVGSAERGNAFEVPRVLTRIDPETMTASDEFVVPPASTLLSAEGDTLWLASGLNEVVGVQATPGTGDLPPAATTSGGRLTFTTETYAGEMPDHIYAPAESADGPTYVLVGGGPVPPSEVRHMSALATALAARGGVAHVVGYRSEATGQGFAETIADIRCAVAYAAEHASRADGTGPVVLVGFSYGGEAVVTAATTPGTASGDCAAGDASVPGGVVALDGFPAPATDTGKDIPMLFVGATGGNGGSGQRVAETMTNAGFDVSYVSVETDHPGAIDPSSATGVVDLMVDFGARIEP